MFCSQVNTIITFKILNTVKEKMRLTRKVKISHNDYEFKIQFKMIPQKVIEDIVQWVFHLKPNNTCYS